MLKSFSVEDQSHYTVSLAYLSTTTRYTFGAKCRSSIECAVPLTVSTPLQIRIAEFAVHAIKCANETPIDVERPELGNLQIRVGFHCGPVVANVVGTRNPR